MNLPVPISVIIPVGPGDAVTARLLRQVRSLTGTDSEIIVVGTEAATNLIAAGDTEEVPEVYFLRSSPGRARQLNYGSEHAQGELLWFLHADSELSRLSSEHFAKPLRRSADRILWYFDLRFFGGPGLKMKINEFGVWFRSRFLGIPFGDQGLLITRRWFWELGRFPEGFAYGEDHLFVWQARANRFRVCYTGGAVGTDARRYLAHGWGSQTLTYLYKTYAQAIPAALGMHPAIRRVVR